jgi:hypothetical protein
VTGALAALTEVWSIFWHRGDLWIAIILATFANESVNDRSWRVVDRCGPFWQEAHENPERQIHVSRRSRRSRGHK